MVSNACKLSRTFKFSSAYDVNKNGGKSFIGYDVIDELEKHILQSTNNHFYEQITTSMRKIYIDIDFGSDSTATKYKYMSITDFDIFISNLINKINLELDILNPVVIVQVAYIIIDNNKMISSCHIIYKNHIMMVNNQKGFIQYMNNKYYYKLDLEVYKKVQLFRMVNMCKIGKTNTLKFYQAMSGDDVNYTFEDCFISNIKDCITITNNYKSSKPIKTKQSTHTAISTPIIKPCYMYTDISTEFVKIINDLNSKFWTSKHWFLITKILIKKQTIFNIFEWLEISASKSNGKYSIAQNNKFYDDWISGDNVINTKSGIPKLTEVLSEYLNYILTYERPFNIDDIINYVVKCDTKKILDISIMRIQFNEDYNIFNKSIDKTKKLILKSENVICDLKTGFIMITGEQTTNYYYDNLINTDKYKIPDYNYNYIFDKINDIEITNILNDFMTNDKRLLIISGSWGVGKTHHIIKTHLNNIGETGNITAITPNNAFNLGITKDFNENGAQSWTSHLELNKITNQDRQNFKTEDYQDAPNVVCSLESIKQIEKKIGHFNHGIYDEFTSIFSHFEANTTNLKDQSKYDTYLSFKNVLLQTDKIIILDANIISDQVATLKNMVDITDEQTESIKINEYAFKNYNHIFYNKTDHFNNTMITDLKQNLRIAITTNSKNATNQYLEAFQLMEFNTNKSILIINGDRIQLIKIIDGSNNTIQTVINYTRPSEKQEFIRNLEDNILNYEVDILIYSPTISMGVSFNKIYFNKVYGNFCKTSLNGRGCLQQIYRIRNLINEEIHILIKDGFKMIQKPNDLETYKKFILRPSQEITRLLKIDDNKFNNDHDYNNIRSINRKENLESTDNFNQIMINYLRYYDAKISYNVEPPKYTNIVIDEVNDILQNKAYDEYLKIDFITPQEFHLLYKMKEEQIEFSDKQHMEFNKYNKLVNTPYYEKEDGLLIYKKNISYGLYDYKVCRDLYNNLLQSKTWFNKYYYKEPSEFKTIKSYLSYKPNDQQDREQIEYNIKKSQNDEFKIQHITGLRNRTLYQIMNLLGINPDGTTTLTNKGLNTIISNNSQFFNTDLINYCKILKIETYEKSNKKDINYYKKVYQIIKRELKRINLIMSYKSKSNTTKPNDKIIIKQDSNMRYNFYNNFTDHTTTHKLILPDTPITDQKYNIIYDCDLKADLKFKYQQTTNNFYNNIYNNNYHRFNQDGSKTIFKNPGKNKRDKDVIIENENMTYKQYNNNEVSKLKRLVFNEHNNKLYKHQLTKDLFIYKEYKIMLSPRYQILKERLTDKYEDNNIFNNVHDEIATLTDLKNKSKSLIEPLDVVKNVLDCIISNVILNSISHDIIKYKTDNNINLHSPTDLNDRYENNHVINCNFNFPKYIK